MKKLRILFADDLIPGQKILKSSDRNGIFDYVVRKKLKKQHPGWSTSFVNESIIMYHAAKTLCSAGYYITTANAYHRAIALSRKSHFDVAVVDLGWHSDESIPSDQRSYAGWKICEEIENLNKSII